MVIFIPLPMNLLLQIYHLLTIAKQQFHFASQLQDEAMTSHPVLHNKITHF